jgi:hypothetical protein
MDKLTEDLLSFDKFCPFCINYQQETGICSKIHQNLKDYPIKFIKKCSGYYFVQNTQKPIVSNTNLLKIKEMNPRRKRKIGCGLIIILCAIGALAQVNILKDFKSNWSYSIGELIVFLVMIFLGVKFIRGKVIK